MVLLSGPLDCCVLFFPFVFIFVSQTLSVSVCIFFLIFFFWYKYKSNRDHNNVLISPVLEKHLEQFLTVDWSHLKTQSTFLDTLWQCLLTYHPWLIAVGCFIFGTAVSIYLFPVWYLSMSKNRLNRSDMPSAVIRLHFNLRERYI